MKHLKNPLDLHAMWRKQMMINAAILAAMSYFFKIGSFDSAALACAIAGCLSYALFWFQRNKMIDENMTRDSNLDLLRISALKTLLSSLSWFVLSAMLYLLSILTTLAILKPYLGA